MTKFQKRGIIAGVVILVLALLIIAAFFIISILAKEGFVFEYQVGHDKIGETFVKSQTIKSSGHTFHLSYAEAGNDYVVKTAYRPIKNESVSKMTIEAQTSDGGVQFTAAQGGEIIIAENISNGKYEYDVSDYNLSPITISIQNQGAHDLSFDIIME